MRRVVAGGGGVFGVWMIFNDGEDVIRWVERSGWTGEG